MTASLHVRRLMRLVQLIIVPVASPAWGIEFVIQRLTRSAWEFKMFWSGTVYILLGFVAGCALVLLPNGALRIVGFYILFAIQVLALAIIAIVPIGSRAGYLQELHNLARRRQQFGRSLSATLGVHTIYAAILCYGYTAFFAGAVSYFFEVSDLGQFSGEPWAPGLATFSEFVYSGFVWMITLGYADLTPVSALAKILTLIAFAVGLVFNILILSLFVDRLTDLRKG